MGEALALPTVLHAGQCRCRHMQAAGYRAQLAGLPGCCARYRRQCLLTKRASQALTPDDMAVALYSDLDPSDVELLSPGSCSMCEHWLADTTTPPATTTMYNEAC